MKSSPPPGGKYAAKALVGEKRKQPAAVGRWLLPPFAVLAVALLLSGCRLLEVRFPGEPLSKEDAKLRFQTREFAATFAASVTKAADEISSQANERQYRTRAGEWKVGAAGAMRRATLRSAPMLALVDAWSLCRQMSGFFEPATTNIFGPFQPRALAAAKALDQQLEGIARQTLSRSEFDKSRQFVADYAAKFPVATLDFNREPVTAHWEAFTGRATAPPGGTTADVLNDLSDRLQVLSEQVPSEVGWRVSLETEGLERTLAEARQALVSLESAVVRISEFTASTPGTISNVVHEFQGAFVPALERLEKQWAASVDALSRERQALTKDLSAERVAILEAVDAQRKAVVNDLTSISPSTISNAVQELGGAFLPALDRLEKRWAASVDALSHERAALTKDLTGEREALVKAVDQQRAAIMKDVESMAVQVTDRSLVHVRGTIKDALFYLVLLAVILLGLPFFFGFLVGRVLGRSPKIPGTVATQ